MADNQEISFKPLTGSLTRSGLSTPDPTSEYATQRARLLLGCYRKGDANDPDTYVAAIAAVLARYPHEIIMAVTHPVTGLPSSSSWLPTIKEVTDACNAAVEPTRQHEARLKRIQQQMEAREREDRGEKPTLEQLHERFGADWGLKQENHKTADMKSEENRAEFERQQARVRAEYEHIGLTAPSKWALSPATLREIAERDLDSSTLPLSVGQRHSG